MLEFWNGSDQTTKMIIIGFLLILVIYTIGILIYNKKLKNNTKSWLEKNPDASKIYLETKSNLIRTNNLVVSTVDGEQPYLFTEGIKRGFYLLPGSHIVESFFSTSRPGIFYKRVTKTYGPTKQELTVESNKIYKYTFDLKNESYEFIEM